MSGPREAQVICRLAHQWGTSSPSGEVLLPGTGVSSPTSVQRSIYPTRGLTSPRARVHAAEDEGMWEISILCSTPICPQAGGSSVKQDSKQVQVDLQDLGYETCGRSENEAEREESTSPGESLGVGLALPH